MNGCLIRLQEIIESLPVVERKVASLILASPGKVLDMQLNELCSSCGASATSVVRLSKRLGYTGFKDLSRAISIDLALQHDHSPVQDALPGANFEDICRAVCNTNIQAIENTLSIMDYDQFGKAVSAIIDAKRIDLYGTGTSELVCHDGFIKFMRLNKISVTVDDAHLQLLSASTLKPGDVAIIISYTGVTFDTIDTMKAAKKTGATVISITKYGDNPISELADIKLYVNNNENISRVSATGSRIGHLTMIDMLFTAVCSQSYYDIKPHIDEMAAVMNLKKMQIR